MDVFDDSIPDVTLDVDVLKVQLKAWMRQLLALPRKSKVGYTGRVIPLECLPIIVGLGADGGFKLMDLREALDANPDQVWHEWLKIYGAELTADAISVERDSGRKIGAGDLLKLLSGDKLSAIGALLELVGGRKR